MLDTINLLNTTTTVTATMETITPMRAKEYLAHSSGNRPIKHTRVDRYSKMMADGSWVFNGEAIQFDKNGRLMNGHHRLFGGIKANVPFISLVVRGLEPEAIKSIDTGTVKTAGHILTIYGGKHVNAIAAACNWIFRYREMLTIRDSRALFHSSSYPHQDIVDFWQANRDQLEKSAVISGRAKVIQVGLGTGFHFLFSEKSVEQADRFFDDLATGANLPKNDGAWLLRERLNTDKTAKHKLSPVERAALIVRAWNQRRNGLRSSYLKGTINSRGEAAFPVIV